jgi:hypothetical protein
MKLRVFLVGLAFIALFAVIGAKAVHLQVYRSPWLAQKASRLNQTASVERCTTVI